MNSEALRFEHLVQINDPADLRIEALTRTQLWRGLLLRAQLPKLFIPWLDSVEIEERDDGSLHRELRFGDYHVRDRVRFTAEQEVQFEIVGAPDDAQFHLTMRIEEPRPEVLFVRFIYTAQSVDHRRENPLSDLVTGAWRQADDETVFRIRQLAASGALDEQ